MDDGMVDKIEESLATNTSGGDGGDDPGDDPDDDKTPAGNTGDADDGVSGGDVPEWAENLQSTVDDLASRLDAQEADRREDLVDAITSNSAFEADELPDSVEKLEAMAEKLDAQTSTTPNYAGRAAGVNSDEFDIEDAPIGGALNSLAEESD